MPTKIEGHSLSTALNSPPDWSVVPFAVHCPRCGHDLHGRTEAKCPTCELTFRWSEAVPIEQLKCLSCGYHLYGLQDPRCPECGKDFTWDGALADYHRRRKPLFEYRWREEPVRSLFHTWWLALRAKKLWTTLDIHDPVQWKPLLISSLVTMLAVLVLVVCGYIVVESMSAIYFFNKFPQYYGARGLSLHDSLILNLMDFLNGLMTSPVCVALTAYFALWSLSMGSALLVFQQSMYRRRLRVKHVWRATVYSSLVVWLGMGLTPVVALAWNNFFDYRTELRVLGILLFVYTLLHSFRSLALAYREYLRMDHPWAVSASAHAIAVLLSLAMPVFLFPSGIGLHVLQRIGEALHLF